jgi:type II secretory pathway component PulF
MVGLVVVGALMMIMVIPQLTAVLAEGGAELPISTKILIAISSFLTNFWWLLILVVFGAVTSLKMLIKTNKGRYYWDFFTLRLPIFGKLFQKIIIVRITRSLNTLMVGGVSLSKSLEIVADISGNTIYREIILETVREVEGGNPVASVFLRSKDVPPMVSQMLNLGEKTGRFDEMLYKIAIFYSREVSNTIANLSSLLEPMIMVIMGVAIGLLVAAIILPMYSLASAL